MAVQIQLKRGTSAPSAGSFAVGEPAWDATNGRLYVKNTAGSMVEINPASNAVTDAAQSFHQGSARINRHADRWGNGHPRLQSWK